MTPATLLPLAVSPLQIVSILFFLLSVVLIVFVLFRRTSTDGLGGAFGGAALSGEGAFGAKSAQVVDSVVTWMCVLFIVLSLLLAQMSSSDPADTKLETTTKSGQSDGDS